MSRAQLQALSADLDRLVNAGATVAAGDEGLRQRAQALRRLGRSVPVLKRIAAQAEEVAKAAPEAAPRLLLDLLVVVRQALVSLAPAGVEGTPESLPVAGPWTTTLPPARLYPLVKAFAPGGSERLPVLKAALNQGPADDARLVGPFLAAVKRGARPLAALVLLRALRPFGPAIMPELRRDLNVQGDELDGFRLLALCQLDQAGGVALCHEVVAQGSAVLRLQALKSLTRLAPAEAEPVALKLLATKEGLKEDLHVAALAALKASRKHAALDALLAAASASPRIWAAAVATLRHLPHPGTTRRLLQELQAAAQAARERRDPVPAVRRASRLVAVLGQRGAALALSVLLDLLKHPAGELRAATGAALIQWGDRSGLEATAALADDPCAWRVGVQATWRLLPPAARYDRLAPLLAGLSHPQKAERERGEFLFSLFREEAQREGAALEWDRRWGPLLARHLTGPNWTRVLEALALLGPAAEDALPILVRALRHVRADLAEGAALALVRIGTLALPALREALGNEDDRLIRARAAHVLGRLGTVAVPAVPDLVRGLADVVGDVRVACAEALGGIGSEARDAVPALAEALRDDRWAVRVAAARTLGALGSAAAAAVPALQEAVQVAQSYQGYDAQEVRAVFTEALARIGGPQG